MDKKQSIGALWLKTSKAGKSFMSGKLEVGGRTVDLVVFKNGYKKEDRHPDYVIYESEKRDQPPQPQVQEISIDEIPF